MFPVNRWIIASRPRTLPAAAVPVFVGTALAWQAGGFRLWPAVICLGFALLIQIGTNFANDYYDFRKGADGVARLGPTRAVSSGLIEPQTMLIATGLVLGGAFVLGLGLIPFGGWWLLAVGVSSVLLAVGYTAGPFPLAYLGLGDVFVILYFGIIAVGFTEFVQTGAFSVEGLLMGFGVGLLTNNLLVVNNYRDAPEDAKVGKRTLAVRFGRDFSGWQFAGSTAVAALTALGVAVGNRWWLLGLAAAIALWIPGDGRHLRRAVTPLEYGTVLAATARRLVFYGVIATVGIAVG